MASSSRGLVGRIVSTIVEMGRLKMGWPDLRSDEDKNLAEDIDDKIRVVDLALDVSLPRIIICPDLAQGVAKGKEGSAHGLQPDHFEALIATSRLFRSRSGQK